MTGYCSRNVGNVWPQQIMCQLQNVGNVWHLYLCFWIPRNSFFVKPAARTSASLSNMCNESKIKQHRSMYAVSLGIDRMRHAHWYCTCSRVPSWRYSSTFLKLLDLQGSPLSKSYNWSSVFNAKLANQPVYTTSGCSQRIWPSSADMAGYLLPLLP